MARRVCGAAAGGGAQRHEGNIMKLNCVNYASSARTVDAVAGRYGMVVGLLKFARARHSRFRVCLRSDTHKNPNDEHNRRHLCTNA